MKIFHLSDLHLGKRVYDFSMLEDQAYLLNQVLEMVDKYTPDAILIAGDVYDKPIPPTEAVKLLDSFLTALVQKNVAVYMISGNHDSTVRLDFGKNLFSENNIHIVGSYQPSEPPIIQKDAYGEVAFYLLPFIKPAVVSQFFAEEEIQTYQEAMEKAIAECNLNLERRNVLLSHQFVTYSGDEIESDSEINPLGGLEKVNASVFFPFDYVALGHLHSPQRIGRDTIRYAGSPLPYSFSEIRVNKALTMIDLEEKGNVKIELLPFTPLRNFREIKGELASLMEAGKAEGGSSDYVRAILTDEGMLYDAVGQLRSLYPNLMTTEIANRQERLRKEELGYGEDTPPQELFRLFFERQNNLEFTAEQEKLVQEIWNEMGELKK